MMTFARVRVFLFVIGLIACCTPFVGTATALISGVLLSLLIGNPWPKETSRLSKILLQLSVVGLGFGLGLGEVIHTGKQSIVYTLVGISLTLAIGYALGKVFKTDRNTSTLLSFGTAICGGSAIAAMAPVLKAKDEETAIALATVFTLNAVGLVLFPLVGHFLHLSQETFGTWAGLAIHDTSSVVGASAAYGAQALAVGTTVKLTRTIWITPVVMGTAWVMKSEQKVKIPLFILGFIAAATIRTVVPEYNDYWGHLAGIAKQCLVATLFLIGTGLNRDVLKKVGIRPLLQGVTLWLVVGSMTLVALLVIGLA
jgi:uncharacterized integral membrane protein (TIGR00698 family)